LPRPATPGITGFTAATIAPFFGFDSARLLVAAEGSTGFSHDVSPLSLK
jgi:hypothetical protein